MTIRLKRKVSGFTLVEVLLVLVIVGIITAVTIPVFVKSMRGNRLRTGARTVVMMGKYARTMSLLQQRELAVIFDINASKIFLLPASEVIIVRDAVGPDGNTVKLPGMATNTVSGQEEEPGAVSPSFQGSAPELTRRLDGVRFEYVELSGGAQQTKGTCAVIYKSNGTCTPYSVKIDDERGASITVHVDALSSVTTEGRSL